MSTYFTSDCHFGHAGILSPRVHCRRADHFRTIQEHDAELARRWNEVVGPEVDVFFLGDFAYKTSLEYAKSIFRQLHGRKRLVRGNHEKIGIKSTGSRSTISWKPRSTGSMW